MEKIEFDDDRMEENYRQGKIDMALSMGYDNVAYCWHCKKDVAVHCMDATCKCGAPFDSSRCEEFKFFPSNKLGKI